MRSRTAYFAFGSLATLLLACGGDARLDDPAIPGFEHSGPGELASAFDSELELCVHESATLNTLLGPMRRSSRPALRVRADTSVLFSEPFDRDLSPLFRVDLRDFDIYPTGAELDSMLSEADGPGSIFPYTPRCAALAHHLFRAVVYRRDHQIDRPRDRAAAERLVADADLETVFVENEVAFDYGHRVEPGGYRVDRVGHCRPEVGELHVIIERHTEIVRYRGAQALALEADYNTGRGACVLAVNARPIESWVDEKPFARRTPPEN